MTTRKSFVKSFISLATYGAEILQPILQKHDTLTAKIISNWKFIMGNEYFDDVTPLKITSYSKNKKKINILHVLVTDSNKSTFLQYYCPIMLEKIAIYTGKNYIQEIRIIQNPLFKDSIELLKKPTYPENMEKFDLSEIQDEEIKSILTEIALYIHN
jgi:hypothetical protein